MDNLASVAIKPKRNHTAMMIAIAVVGGIMALGLLLFAIISWRKRTVRIRPRNFSEISSVGINTNAAAPDVKLT